MTSVAHTSKQCKALLSSVALSCFLVPAEGSLQPAQSHHVLDPVVVQPTATPTRARRTTSGKPTRAARSRQQRNVAANTGAPVATPTGPVFAAPTLNLTGTNSTGSRLGLTRLQTPGSVEVISAETMAERGQQNVVDAVTQNATGFTAIGEPGNGGIAFSTRGFAGNGRAPTLAARASATVNCTSAPAS